MLYFIYPISKTVYFQHVVNIKNINEIVYLLFYSESSKSGVYVTLTENFSMNATCLSIYLIYIYIS